MKDLFPGYYRISDDELETLCRSCTIAIDANFLLDVFRTGEKTRNAILQTLGDLQSRVWLPYQAGLEYHRDRQKVIADSLNEYGNMKKELAAAVESLKQMVVKNRVFDPAESKNLTAILDTAKDQAENLIDSWMKDHPDQKKIAAIETKIGEIFDGRVGSRPTEEQMVEFIREGERRVRDEIPPGYKDKIKGGLRQYGDFILWKQCVAHAATTKRGLVLVTNDKKEDWWERGHGKTVGPRPELVQEMFHEAGVKFHLYNGDQFITHAREFGPVKLTKTAAKRAANELFQTRGRIGRLEATIPPSLLKQSTGFGMTSDSLRLAIGLSSYLSDNNRDKEEWLRRIGAMPATDPALKIGDVIYRNLYGNNQPQNGRLGERSPGDENGSGDEYGSDEPQMTDEKKR